MLLSKRVILMGDWNAVLDPNLDRGASSAGTNTGCQIFSRVCRTTLSH